MLICVNLLVTLIHVQKHKYVSVNIGYCVATHTININFIQIYKLKMPVRQADYKQEHVSDVVTFIYQLLLCVFAGNQGRIQKRYGRVYDTRECTTGSN
jgi:hypothetical protein